MLTEDDVAACNAPVSLVMTNGTSDVLGTATDCITTLVNGASVIDSPGVAAATLASLNTVAGGGANLTQSSAKQLVDALSTVASAVISGGASTGTADQTNALLQSVVAGSNAVAASLLAGLSAAPVNASAPPPRIVFSTQNFQMALTVGPMSLTAPISVNGSAAAFSPLPAAATANASNSLGSTFASFAFNPYPAPNASAGIGNVTAGSSAATSSQVSTSGMVRLALSDGGQPFPVHNLSMPILFNMTVVNQTSGRGTSCRRGQGLLECGELLPRSCCLGKP